MSASQSLSLEKRQNGTSSSIYNFSLFNFFFLIIYRNFIFQVRLTWKDMSPFRWLFFLLSLAASEDMFFFFLCSPLFQPIMGPKRLHRFQICCVLFVQSPSASSDSPLKWAHTSLGGVVIWWGVQSLESARVEPCPHPQPAAQPWWSHLNLSASVSSPVNLELW